MEDARLHQDVGSAKWVMPILLATGSYQKQEGHPVAPRTPGAQGMNQGFGDSRVKGPNQEWSWGQPPILLPSHQQEKQRLRDSPWPSSRRVGGASDAAQPSTASDGATAATRGRRNGETFRGSWGYLTSIWLRIC